MKESFRLLLAGVLGALAAYFHMLLVPLAVLVAVMLTDYLTGMLRAARTGGLSSRTGVAGILKKAGYLALVAVGMTVDYLISHALTTVGIHLQINYCFGVMLTIWLIINELISILENLGALHIPLPQFLTQTIQALRDRVEARAEKGRHFKKD